MKKLFLISLCTLFFACSEKQVEKIPGNVLTKEKMAEVLVDVHLLESSMNLNPDVATVGSAPMEVGADVLKKNGITKQQYDESIDFYTKHPELLGGIYELVLNTLSKMQAEAMNEK